LLAASTTSSDEENVMKSLMQRALEPRKQLTMFLNKALNTAQLAH